MTGDVVIDGPAAERMGDEGDAPGLRIGDDACEGFDPDVALGLEG